MRYTMNVTTADTCRVCDDTGYVELDGRDAHNYTRGSSPCRWCEQGKRRYTRLAATRWTPDMDYTLEDVVGFVGAGQHVTASPDEARRAIAVMRTAVRPVPAGETATDIEARKHAAHRAIAQDYLTNGGNDGKLSS